MAKDLAEGGSSFFDYEVDECELQYGRLASDVLVTLQEAVELRCKHGETKSGLAAAIGKNRSQLSRILNGSIKNLTLKTISDILWATRHRPNDFQAQPYEKLCANMTCGPRIAKVIGDDGRMIVTNIVSGDNPMSVTSEPVGRFIYVAVNKQGMSVHS